MTTLKEILIKEQKTRNENGMFGINACKESIKNDSKHCHKSYYELLEEYVNRANSDPFFNQAMVLACWELINQ